MYEKLIIIGAGGHGKVIADIAERMGRYKSIMFFDDGSLAKTCMNYPIVGKSDDAIMYVDEADFFVAIGNSESRKKIMQHLVEIGANIPVLVHPMASVAKCVSIGKGTVVMAGAVINSDTRIGEGCIINTCSSVDHDCCVGEYVHVAVGAHLCGTVEVGSFTFVGAGATVKNNIRICNDCMIGAGATIVKNIEEAGTYIGVPAKIVEIG